MSEVWKDIKGYEGYYQISNLGNVKSLDYNHTGREELLKLNKTRCGYLLAGLSHSGIQKWCSVHRLVALAFIPNPDNKYTVNHKNEDKTDNRVDNLEWMTSKENNNHGTRNKISAKARINKNCKSVLQFDFSGNLLKEWPSAVEVQRQLGYKFEAIYGTCSGLYTQAYGYVWRYADDERPLDVSNVFIKTRAVLQCDLNGEVIKTFSSIKEAAQNNGLRSPNIIACCSGKSKTCGGYKWQYAA